MVIPAFFVERDEWGYFFYHVLSIPYSLFILICYWCSSRCFENFSIPHLAASEQWFRETINSLQFPFDASISRRQQEYRSTRKRSKLLRSCSLDAWLIHLEGLEC